MNQSILFDDHNQTFEIVDGTVGTYKYKDVLRVSILNEKAKYKGLGVPFTAVLPGGPLPSGILSDPYLYVGIKIVLKNQSILAVYISKNKTMVNTDQYIQDRKEAEKVCRKLLSVRDSILFDDYNQTFEIVDGTVGTYKYADILKCSIQNEVASFKGKSKPFVHTILGGTTFMSGVVEPKMYVGLKIVLKDNTILAAYVSKKPVLFHSDTYFKDKEMALEISKKIEEGMKYEKVSSMSK